MMSLLPRSTRTEFADRLKAQVMRFVDVIVMDAQDKLEPVHSIFLPF